ncbi:hypothetical protein [Adlercreutzia caecimuris]|uniref:hypothetical protein n=1 Tax=Adlercreutzia caecimuris TaxID=671266 RepID=UPI00258ABF6B|nr:hypothetical protein [Adlercreutzia caecimuris]
MLLDYGRGPEECRMGLKAMSAYEQEFGRDIIQDLFGRVTVREPEPDEEGVVASVDYRDTNWTALVRALWASRRAADESVPPYAVWADGIDALDLNAVSDALMPEAVRTFFHAGDSGRPEAQDRG